MKTSFVSEGINLNYTPAADVAAGDIVFIGSLCTQVTDSLKAGQLGAVRRQGVIKVNKNLADVFAAGADVHWVAATSLASLVAADGKMGIAVGGGTATDTYVEVLLNQ